MRASGRLDDDGPIGGRAPRVALRIGFVTDGEEGAVVTDVARSCRFGQRAPRLMRNGPVM